MTNKVIEKDTSQLNNMMRIGGGTQLQQPYYSRRPINNTTILYLR
jgi:hypothetical protein